MLITKKSAFTGIEHTLEIPVTQAQLDLWKSGVSIQNAMPNISAEDREFIKTGVTAQEWNDTFGAEV